MLLPWLLAALSACAAPPPRPGGAELVVTDADTRAELWRGPASYQLRPPARVIGLPGVGELQVTDLGCRLVWAQDGPLLLVVLPGERACPQAEPRRLCFSSARFAASIDGHERALVVDGCAEENDLLESRLGSTREATVGPVDWRRRCAPLPTATRGCEVSYLALRTIEHESNADAGSGFSFVWDGDRFSACFLERDAGRYRLVLLLEDSCGAAETMTLRGHSDELD